MVTLMKMYPADPIEKDGVLRSRAVFILAGLSGDTKPAVEYDGTLIANGSKYQAIGAACYTYDEENHAWVEDAGGSGSGAVTMQDVLAAIQASIASSANTARVISLDATPFMSEGIIEAVGNPVYVSDVSGYSAYSLTDTGWYVFARIYAQYGITVASETTVQGAEGYVKTVGASYVDVAVRFDTAAVSKVVTVAWDEGRSDTFAFRASDLAIRNLDYRSTYYVYDIAPFVTWTYALTTDNAFVAGKKYYTEDDGEYSLETVTTGDPAIYYTQSVSYALTTDETFADGKTYYTKSGGEYTAAEVTTGEAVPAETYYVQSISYNRASGTFADTTYYIYSNNAYTAAEVTAGADIPEYYTHSKLTISGMTRNLTYRLDTTVDCPMEIVLPEISDGESYGAWFDIQLKHGGSYSVTITPPTGVKMATNNTPNPTKGINYLHLHYAYIDGAKVWSAMNTHTDFTE